MITFLYFSIHMMGEPYIKNYVNNFLLDTFNTLDIGYQNLSLDLYLPDNIYVDNEANILLPFNVNVYEGYTFT